MPVFKNFDKNFFKTWSRDMAYVLGFLYADGNIVVSKRKTHFVALYSADRDLVELVREAVGSDHKISERKSTTGVVYRLQVGSKEWFFDLYKLGLTPSKSNRMKVPMMPKSLRQDFVRGYFDGDGNVWTGFVHKQRKTSHNVLQVAFTSASHDFLQGLRDSLSSMGVQGGSLYTSKTKNFSRLSYSTKDALLIYKIMYNDAHKLYLPRKKCVFEKFDNCGGSSTG